MEIHGKTIDDAARCIHYHTDKDVVAIMFKCCDRFYACFHCHQESETHPVRRWPETEFQEQAILCGVCRAQMTITDYRRTSSCNNCGAAFNENCRHHAGLYFDTGQYPSAAQKSK